MARELFHQPRVFLYLNTRNIQYLRNCPKITCAISAGCFFECKKKNAGDAGIDEAF